MYILYINDMAVLLYDTLCVHFTSSVATKEIVRQIVQLNLGVGKITLVAIKVDGFLVVILGE